MRNLAKIATGLLLALAVSGPAFADIKIISIRAAEIVRNSPQAKDAQAQMKKEFEKRQNDLEAEAKKFQDDVENMRKEGDLMSPDARAKAQRDLTTRKADLEYKQGQFQQDVQKRNSELLDKLGNAVRGVVEQIAKERSADLVIQDPIYAGPSIDVTDEVVKRLAATAGGAGGAPAPGGK